MTYSLEINFDATTEATIRECWEALATAGISRSMLDADATPHVTLSMTDEADLERFIPWLEGFAAEVGPFALFFQAIGCFPSTGVLFFAPTVTQALLTLHRDFHAGQPPGWQPKNSYYLPERWVPHCTAAFNLCADRLGDGLTLLAQTSLPLTGSVRQLTVNEVLPGPKVRRLGNISLYPQRSRNA
jgi:hypothetical protein